MTPKQVFDKIWKAAIRQNFAVAYDPFEGCRYFEPKLKIGCAIGAAFIRPELAGRCEGAGVRAAAGLAAGLDPDGWAPAPAAAELGHVLTETIGEDWTAHVELLADCQLAHDGAGGDGDEQVEANYRRRLWEVGRKHKLV